MEQRTLIRVGHKGADLIAPGNTLASFDAALAAGVDMIEFDVVPAEPSDPVTRKAVLDGRPPGEVPLVLAHDWVDAGKRVPATIDEGLDHLSGEAFDSIELDVDLKLPGYELRVVEALKARGLLARSLISSQYVDSLATIRQAEPDARLGWSVPRLTRDPFRSPLLAPAGHVAAALARAVLPGRAAAMISSGRCDALMSHWRLVTPRLVRSVRDAGGELYVWTVDELPRIRALDALGVTGVITNDPRLFAALA